MSDPDFEDVTQNPFFLTLKNKFNGIYQQIENNCWFLCIPKARSCSGLKYSKEIFGMNDLIVLIAFNWILVTI
jgi:hypothetical protein